MEDPYQTSKRKRTSSKDPYTSNIENADYTQRSSSHTKNYHSTIARFPDFNRENKHETRFLSQAYNTHNTGNRVNNSNLGPLKTNQTTFM